jgi:hypothetical protein
MTRLRHCLAAALLAVSAGLAHAVTQDITLTATVPSVCTVSGSATPTAATQNLTIDPTGRVSTSTLNLSFPIACNNAATLAVSSVNTGLTGPAAVAGYENKIDYTAVTSGVFPQITLNTAGAPPTSVLSAGPANGTLAVAITPTANVNPLASGLYSETLRLTITPAQ